MAVHPTCVRPKGAKGQSLDTATSREQSVAHLGVEGDLRRVKSSSVGQRGEGEEQTAREGGAHLAIRGRHLGKDGQEGPDKVQHANHLAGACLDGAGGREGGRGESGRDRRDGRGGGYRGEGAASRGWLAWDETRGRLSRAKGARASEPGGEPGGAGDAPTDHVAPLLGPPRPVSHSDDRR